MRTWLPIGRAPSRPEEELPGTMSDVNGKADQREGPKLSQLNTWTALKLPLYQESLQQASLNVDASLPFKAGRWLQRKQTFHEVKERMSYPGKSSGSTLKKVFTQRTGRPNLEFHCHIS